MTEIQYLSGCEDIRKIISDNVDYISNTEVFLDEGDEGYEDQAATLSAALQAVEDAFKAKPVNCKMEVSGDVTYDCASCRFFKELP